jgi:hypothetical protein
LRIAANAIVPGLGSALRSHLRVGSHPDADAGAAAFPPLGRFSRFYRCYGGGPAWIVRRRWPRRQAGAAWLSDDARAGGDALAQLMAGMTAGRVTGTAPPACPADGKPGAGR